MIASASLAPTLPPELGTVYVRDSGTFKGIGGGCFQARCDKCSRMSPVVTGCLDDFLGRVAELGWSMTAKETWRCPLCINTNVGRYTLR